MNQKITNTILLFIILIMSFIASCKSEKPKTLSAYPENKSPNVFVEEEEAIPADVDNIDSFEIKLTELTELLDSIKNTRLPTEASERKIKEKDISSKQGNVVPTEKRKKQKKKLKNKKKPQIKFEELVWDFGEIIEGDIIEKQFKFTNTGNAPLEIIATSVTCGCTMPSFPFLEIAPGESNVIGVKYNSVGKDGVQNPEVTIESNTYPKTTVLRLQGTVKTREENKPILVKDSVRINN